MKQRVDIFVPGDPKPQGSKRRAKSGAIIEDNPGTRPWRETVTWTLLDNKSENFETITCPVAVEIILFFTRPKFHFNKYGVRAGSPIYKGTRPDADKLARAILDSLVDAGVLRDDGQVAFLVVSKMYANEAGARIRVSERRQIVGKEV